MLNPLLSDHALPAFSQIGPELVAPTIGQLLADNRSAIAELTRQTAPDWQSLPARLEQLDDKLSKAWALVSHLNAVTNSPAWREAYNGCLAQISAYYTELGQNTELYRHYQLLADSAGFSQLSQAQQQTILNALRDFKLSGVALPPAEKQRFAEIEERLSALCAKFADNLLDATQAWCKPLSEDELQGIPDTSKGLRPEPNSSPQAASRRSIWLSSSLRRAGRKAAGSSPKAWQKGVPSTKAWGTGRPMAASRAAISKMMAK